MISFICSISSACNCFGILSLVQLRWFLSSSYHIQINVCVQFHLSSRGRLEMALCARAQGRVRNEEAQARGHSSACPGALPTSSTSQDHSHFSLWWTRREEAHISSFPIIYLFQASLYAKQRGVFMDKKLAGRVQISTLQARSLSPEQQSGPVSFWGPRVCCSARTHASYHLLQGAHECLTCHLSYWMAALVFPKA